MIRRFNQRRQGRPPKSVGLTPFRTLAGCLGLLLFFLSGGVPSAGAQEMNAPMELQVTTLEKILEFDRNFHDRVGDEVVLGILFQSRFRLSANALRDFQRVVEDQELRALRGIPIRIVPIEYSNASDLVRIIEGENLDLMYLTPLRSVSLRSITDLSRESEVPTLTGVAEYVEEGVAVGVTVQGQRLRILVNLSGARSEGMDLSSELLKLATVLEGGR